MAVNISTTSAFLNSATRLRRPCTNPAGSNQAAPAAHPPSSARQRDGSGPATTAAIASKPAPAQDERGATLIGDLLGRNRGDDSSAYRLVPATQAEATRPARRPSHNCRLMVSF